MGNGIGIIGRIGIARLKRFNVNNRARRVLDKEKPQRAPTFEANLKESEQITKKFPEIVETLENKDNTLLQNLENLYVVAKREDSSIKQVESGPKGGKLYRYDEDSQFHISSEQGTYEITNIMDVMMQFKENPNLNTIPVLSKKYRINESTLRNILTYVKLFDMYAPPKTKKAYLERLGKEMMPSMENHLAKDKARYEFVMLHYKRLEEEEKNKHQHKVKSSPVDVSQSTGKPLNINDVDENDENKSRLTSDKKSQ